MTDVERRITDALRGVAEDAPPSAGLADAARARSRSRRRRTALASVASVVAVATVVGGVALLGSGGGGTPDRVPAADDPPSAVTSDVVAPTDGRVETWRNLSVTVPRDWGYGHLSTWCLNGKSEPGTPVVERPGGVVESIACAGPENGYGVQFLDGSLADMANEPGELRQYEPGDGKVYPDGAWLGYQRAADNLVLVVAQSRAEAQTVLDSVTRLGSEQTDGNGCTTHDDTAPVTYAAAGTLRLCRYSLDGWLEQSEVLTGADAADAVAALAEGPIGTGCAARPAVPMVRVTSADADGFVTLDSCQGLTWDGQHHDLTGDVLHWVLSPGWSGQVPDGITFQPRS